MHAIIIGTGTGGLIAAEIQFDQEGQIEGNDDKEIEKGQVGRVWANRSAGRAVFAMLYKLEQGRGLAPQIDAALAQPGAGGALVSSRA